MADKDDAQPTQKTQPKKGKPVEIPVPKRKEVLEFMRGVSGKRPAPPNGSKT
jgi:hypothetical protein